MSRTTTQDPVDLDFLRQEFNRFKNELAGMKDRMGGNADQVLGQMSSYLNTGAVTSRLANLEAELESLGASLGATLKGSGKQAVGRIEKEVADRPIASIAIAFGMGMLASQFFRRS
jgi:ElaB/YqjD/DUF883 family membrane-anchored ribosome-binding protein